MKIYFLLFVMAFAALQGVAQNPALNCGGGRYDNFIFQNVTKADGVIYGYNKTTDFFTTVMYNDTLRFNLFQPQGDVAGQRPLVILMFGGGFVTGQRSDLDTFCIALAQKGYVAATIDYRLVYPSFLNYLTVFGNGGLLYDQVVKSSVDLKAAIRYFKRDAATTNTYKIDTTKIIVGGASAGAIAALQAVYTTSTTENPAATTAYNNNGGFEGNTDLPAPNNLLPAYNSRGTFGVISIAGGIPDTSLMNSGEPPLYISHGSADEVVPYNFGQVANMGFTTPLFLYGGNSLNERAQNVGIASQLLTVPGGNHESPGTEPYISQIIQQMPAFFAPLVCRGSLPVTLSTFTIQLNNRAPLLHWKTASEANSSHFAIELSNDGTTYNTVSMVKSNNSVTGGSYSYQLPYQNNNAWLRLKMIDKDEKYTYSPVQRFTSCKGVVRTWPNPVRQTANISGLQKGMVVKLLNNQGILLLQQTALGNVLQLPMQRYASGIYMVQVINQQGRVTSTTPLVKQ